MQFRELPSEEENYTRIVTIDYQREENKFILTLRNEVLYDITIACLSTYRLLSRIDPEMQLGTIEYSGNRHTITIFATSPAQLLDSLCSTHTISGEIYTRMLREFRELAINPRSHFDGETLETSAALEDSRSPLLSRV